MTPPFASETQTGSALLNVVGWTALIVAALCALMILWDIFVRGRRQEMAVMNAVYPITALYWGPVALWFYRRRDRLPGWGSTAKGVSHCGAGCTLGDVVGEWLVYLTGWTVALFANPAANTLMAAFVADFVFAWTLGIAFQYFSIVPMRDVGRLEGVWLAIKADTLSIVSFQAGLFGFMALYHLVLFEPPLSVASSGYWMLMQVGMIIGFFTSWPVNAWLIRRGWKEAM